VVFAVFDCNRTEMPFAEDWHDRWVTSIGDPSSGQSEWVPVYAPWWRRVYSALVDFAGLALVAGIFKVIGHPAAAGGIAYAAVLWGFFNAWLGGRTGQSVGKRVAGTTLLNDDFFGLVGGVNGMLRVIVHIVDSLPMEIGYLVPLVDGKRRCFADMIMKTVVVTNPPPWAVRAVSSASDSPPGPIATLT
jgi:uncharacterized RDD family membrane protein YckC